MSDISDEELLQDYLDSGLTFSSNAIEGDKSAEQQELQELRDLGLTIIPSYVFTKVPRDFLISINDQFINTTKEGQTAGALNSSPTNTSSSDSDAQLLKTVLERDKTPLHARMLSCNTSYSLEECTMNFAVQLSDSEYFYFIRTHQLPIFIMSEVQVFRTSRYIYEIAPKNLQEGDSAKLDYSVLYFRRFWGLITNISSVGSPGDRRLNVTCESLLHFMKLSPLATGQRMESLIVYLKEVQGDNENMLNAENYVLEPYSNFNRNIMQTILWAFQRAFKYFSIPQGISFDQSDPAAQNQAVDWAQTQQEVMGYWKQRLGSIAQAVRIFGLESVDWVEENNPENKVVRSGTSRDANAWDEPEVNNSPYASLDYGIINFFYPNWGGISSGNFLQGDNVTLYDFLKEMTQMIGFEFFQDVDGSIVIKPPLYNCITNDIDNLGNLTYTIKSEDIVDFSTTENESNVFTALEVRGDWFPGTAAQDQFQPYGLYIDRNLASTFGLRYHQMKVPYLKTEAECRLFARMTLSEINQASFSINLVIIERAELHIGLPIYIEPMDIYGYISAIDSPVQHGSVVTQTLTLTAIRFRLYDEEGRIMYNAALVRTQEATDAAIDFGSDEEESLSGDRNLISTQDVHGGEYKLEYFTERPTEENSTHMYATSDYIPLTDYLGYRVIGSLPYGRGMKLTRNHQLVWAHDFTINFQLPDGSTDQKSVKKGDVVTSANVTFENDTRDEGEGTAFYQDPSFQIASKLSEMTVPTGRGGV